MTKLTMLETAILKAIDDSEYGEYLEDAIWTFSVWDNVDRKVVKNRTSLSGGVSSLTQKRLVRVAGSGKEAEISMTDAGAAALVATGMTLNKKSHKRKDEGDCFEVTVTTTIAATYTVRAKTEREAIDKAHDRLLVDASKVGDTVSASDVLEYPLVTRM